MTAFTPYRSELRPGRDRFAQLLRAEWTKFRTVRGWVIGMIVAVLVTAGIGLLSSGGAQSSCQQAQVGSNGQVGGSGPVRSGAGCVPTFPLGPGGEPVTDSFYLVRQPLTGDGSITVRVTSLTGLLPPANPANALPQGPTPSQPGLEPWAKAGIIIKQNTNQGSPYAAMMVAAGHGVRMQWNYTADAPGLSGTVGPTNPRWLRLTRSGDVITGYDSADGTHWTEVGTVTLSGLPSTVQAGLFAASPYDSPESLNFGGGTSGRGGGSTRATAVIDHVSGFGGAWTGEYIGAADASGIGGYHQAGGRFTVTGSGDIAPIPAGHGNAADSALTVADYLIGTFAGLIAIAVVAAMFITAEYRRGLIRVTLAASPRRGRVLAAKAIAVAAVSFVAGLAGGAVAVLAGGAITRARGYYEFPLGWPTELRVVVGAGLLAAVVAVLALAVGAMVRRGAAAIAVAIVAIVVPYFLSVAAVVPLGAADWLLRITPAAGFAIIGPYPQYPQVTALYAPLSGYFPLSPWAGLAVLCGWAAATLAGAFYLLRRRDA
jgi:ABC-type transport system involved in multi-copper enzyme maturation permease subunit